MSIMENSVLDNREKRSNPFNPNFTFRPSYTIDSAFGTGKSPWSTRGSIWSNSAAFADDNSDTTPLRNGSNNTNSRPAPATSPANPNTTSFGSVQSIGKIGSKALLASSEGESWPSGSNVPWTTTTRPTKVPHSESQHQASPNRSHFGDSFSSTQTNRSASDLRDARPSSQRQHSALTSPTSLQAPEFKSFISRQDMTAVPEFQPSAFLTANYRAQNLRRFEANDVQSHFGSSQNPLQKRADFADPGQSSQLRQTYINPAARSIDNTIGTQRGFQAASNANFVAAAHSTDWDHVSHASKTAQHPGFTEDAAHASAAYNNILIQPMNNLQLANSNYSKIASSDNHSLQARSHPSFPQAGSYQMSSSLSQDQANGPFLAEALSGIQPFSGSQAIAHAVPYYRSTSFGGPPTESTTTSDFRTGLQTPHYSTSTTPPTGPESFRSVNGSGLSSRASNGPGNGINGKLHVHDHFQAANQHIYGNNPLQSPGAYSGTFANDYAGYTATNRGNPLYNPYLLPGYVNMANFSQPGRYPQRPQDSSQIIRSPLLEEFRTNGKTNRHYELRDIYNHMVEFSGDQHGSRFIQQKLETANSDEKDQIFAEILPDSLQLMTDVFGNYVVQKLFEHGNQSQKKLLANQMRTHVLSLSLQMYGCRVVQKALEHVLTDQQASIVKELEGQVMRCVKDQNGNHVIQKAIERVPPEHVQFIVDAFHREVQRLATHPYGCRVIQRILEHCLPHAKQSILAELHACLPLLITDQFGNYVIQHVIENGGLEDRRTVVSIVQSQLLVYSKHKFASNVVEKSIEFAEEPQRRQMLHMLTAPNERGEGTVFGLIRDQYGNYVIQKVLHQVHGAEREALIYQIKSQLVHLKRLNCGKQITAIEKVIYETEQHSSGSSVPSSAMPSAAASTNASTVEGPITPAQGQPVTAVHPHDSQAALPLAMPPAP